MKTDYALELAKTLGFMALGYWGFLHFGSAIYAIPLALLGSAIVQFTYKLGSKT